MAISNENSLVSKLHVEAIQTIVPTKPTDPRQSFKLLISPQNDHLNSILQRRFHIILCYDRACDEDSGWLVAGRLKESLGRALQDEPLLAGRLRRCEDQCGEELEIVSNDSGVRLVEARVDVKLADFVELKGGKEGFEGELVFWEDVVEKNPQFSPLFYVQVTNFTCGGYSIGISCSLLLEDPFVLTTFLKRFSKTDVPKIPTFYHPNFGKPTSSPSLLMGSNNSGKNAAQSVIFKIPTKILDLDNNIHKKIAGLCIGEAERVTGRKMASNLSLFVKVPFEDAKVEICSRQVLLESSLGKINGLTCERTWDDLGLESICFNEGNKPVYVSCWINSVVDDEGFVMIIPSSDDNTSGMRIIVTFT
ncbi:hypothetical protein DH2020_038466 [Rehmannia glutinosa]|uniref:Uncharacterized protein n=1 Tax=Rehmannia glutinosa TaxID=99300 RepID=A0ABR0UYM1_REHGL